MTNKIETIEEQIKKLQEKKRKAETKQRTKVGKYVLDKWEIEDEETAFEIIDYLTPKVKEYLESKNVKSGEQNAIPVTNSN